MASTQKRWLTQPNSKVGKHPDLAAILRRDIAWETLPAEKREELYSLLPQVPGGHNIDVNPLDTAFRVHIEEEVRVYQTDLNDGKETKKWREEAMKAGLERSSGAWDAAKEQQRQEEWGDRGEATPGNHKTVTGKEARELAVKAATGGTQS